jgi:hypothetical protein
MNKKWLLLPIGVGAVVIIGYVGGTLVQWLWNWLMPDLFGWRQVTFWQALGLLALCRILFGGLRLGDSSSKGKHVTREEGARIRERMREQCETPGAGGPSTTPAS